MTSTTVKESKYSHKPSFLSRPNTELFLKKNKHKILMFSCLESSQTPHFSYQPAQVKWMNVAVIQTIYQVLWHSLFNMLTPAHNPPSAPTFALEFPVSIFFSNYFFIFLCTHSQFSFRMERGRLWNLVYFFSWLSRGCRVLQRYSTGVREDPP